MGEMTARLTRARAAAESQSASMDSDGVERRIARLLRELLATYSEALLALLAEESVAPEAQRERMNSLVRTLGEIKFEDELRSGGRNIPLRVDAASTPPTIQVHRQLIAGIEDAQVLRAFHTPIADILGISPVGVGLVLNCQDARQLKSLVAQAGRRAGAQRVRITQVEAVVAQRVQLFTARLEAVSENFGEDIFWLCSGEGDFKAQLAERYDGWPDWDGIQEQPYIRGLVDELRPRTKVREDMPSAEILVELCWESLELSPQSFLRHSAQTLRAHDGRHDLVGALRKLANAIGMHGEESFYAVDTWPIYRDLAQAWDELFQAEQAMLPGAATRRRAPGISVLDCPLESVGLCEPSTLPWDAPLLSWTVREHHGLRDLLVGLRNTLEDQSSKSGVFSVDIPSDPPEAPLEVTQPRKPLQIQVVRRGYILPDAYPALLMRAMNACHASMNARFERLDKPGQQRVLRTLRSAYDGYFADARGLWSRRFQAWDKWPVQRAFRVLSTEVRHIVGPAMLFDPFDSPESEQLAPAPRFILVAPRPEEFERVLVQMPLAALKKSMRGAPIRIRLVDVRDGQDCRWAGDLAVTLATVEEFPTGAVMESIENDSVRLLIQDADGHF